MNPAFRPRWRTEFRWTEKRILACDPVFLAHCRAYIAAGTPDEELVPPPPEVRERVMAEIRRLRGAA